MFMNLRLAADQTFENATSMGAIPWTWPRDEQAIDLIYKGIYAFTTGAVADATVVGPRPRALVARAGCRPGRDL